MFPPVGSAHFSTEPLGGPIFMPDSAGANPAPPTVPPREPAFPPAASLPNPWNPSNPIRNMRLTFWGVQGSCPIFPTTEEIRDYAQYVASYAVSHSTPGDPSHPGPSVDLPDLPNYGGETSCIEVETSEGNILVLDLGSGVRTFSRALLAKWQTRKERTLHVFGTHPHLDHRQGLSFASFCFARPPVAIPVYGSHLFLQALDDRYGLFSRQLTPAMHLDDPLDFRLMSAKFTATELRPPGSEIVGKTPWPVHDASHPVHVGATSVTAFPTYHGPTPCLAYKVRHGSASFVYCTDHELRHGPDPTDPRQLASEAAEAEIRRQCQGVDVAYFDGQYLTAEYHAKQGIGLNPPVPRLDWGHGCLEDVLSRADQCRIGRTYAGHHDPERPYTHRFHLDQDLLRWSKSSGVHVELAKAGAVIDL